MAPINERIETVAVGPGAATHSRISWGAIFAGWLVATAVAGLLYLAGLALGFAAFDPNATTGAIKGIGVGTAIWLIATWAAGLFVGGMFASWFDGKSDQTAGAIHGVAVWGLSVTGAAVWMTLGMGQALHHRDPAPRPGLNHQRLGGVTGGERRQIVGARTTASPDAWAALQPDRHGHGRVDLSGRESAALRRAHWPPPVR